MNKTKTKGRRLAGKLLHYCSRCQGRFQANRLNIWWGRVVCDGCLTRKETDALNEAESEVPLPRAVRHQR